MIDLLNPLISTPAVRDAALGTTLLGLTAGAVGCFAVLRRQSLQGDVVSHAALPGIGIAFLLGARSPVGLILGGAVAGWLALVLVSVVSNRSRVPIDASLGGCLAVFFGFGLALMRYVQVHVPDAARHPLDRYLFGQAAFLRDADLWAIGTLGFVTLLILYLKWNDLKLLVFDPDFAASLGISVRRLDLLLTTLTVVAVVIGLKAVGVVLMTALLVAPAVAAGQWTNRLGIMVLLGGTFGALAGVSGTLLSHHLGSRTAVPTGPSIVLIATSLVCISLVIGSTRGFLWTRQIALPLRLGK
jgi:manganese/zinc/iron transport system permease protein